MISVKNIFKDTKEKTSDESHRSLSNLIFF